MAEHPVYHHTKINIYGTHLDMPSKPADGSTVFGQASPGNPFKGPELTVQFVRITLRSRLLDRVML